MKVLFADNALGQTNKIYLTGPDSLVVRASASGSEGRGFAPRPRHTKGVKNGTGSSLADARNKRVVLGRYKNAGRYLLLLCRSKSSTELKLSVSKRDVKQSFFILSLSFSLSLCTNDIEMCFCLNMCFSID